MHRKKLYRSIRKHGTGIRQRVATSPFFDAEDVHSFRTHVKKVRAFIHWLGKEGSPLSPSFKETYRISGQLRDIQVLLQYLEEKGLHDSGFANWLRENADRLQQLWDDNYDPTLFRRLERSLQRTELRKPSSRRLRSFVHKKVDRIESIVYLPAPADDDLHNIRKELKDMYFVYMWCMKNDCVKEDDPMPDELKKLGELCGEFNDKRIALGLLAAYIQQASTAEARQEAEILQRQWEQERLADRKQLLQTLRAFVDRQ